MTAVRKKSIGGRQIARTAIALALIAAAAFFAWTLVAPDQRPVVKRRRIKDPKVRQALADLESLKGSLLAYRADVGELPPRGDYCGVCQGYKDGRKVSDGKSLSQTDPRARMVELEQALVSEEGPGWKGPYIEQAIPIDPWGREYSYDDNDPRGANGQDTYVFSSGPDGAYNNDDDVRVLVLSKADGERPLEEWKKIYEQEKKNRPR